LGQVLSVGCKFPSRLPSFIRQVRQHGRGAFQVFGADLKPHAIYSEDGVKWAGDAIGVFIGEKTIDLGSLKHRSRGDCLGEAVKYSHGEHAIGIVKKQHWEFLKHAPRALGLARNRHGSATTVEAEN